LVQEQQQQQQKQQQKRQQQQQQQQQHKDTVENQRCGVLPSGTLRQTSEAASDGHMYL
jgi:hypothetical protein